MILVLIDHDRGVIAESSLEAVTAARSLGTEVHAALLGEVAVSPLLSRHGVAAVHVLDHELLADFAAAAWGEALAQLVASLRPEAVLATGSERGNEVMAHLAARTGLPLAANCTEIDPAGGSWDLVRVRWGGSLLERARLTAEIKLATVAEHTVPAEPAPEEAAAAMQTFHPDLDPALAATGVVDRAEAEQGVTLTTAPVVVGGGRGVGSAEGFAVIEELAKLLGGAVGCSRVATNNGWRPHADQVGQTGTRIAPDLYIACGISGAIQHWVGCMASKKILAINNDPEAPMVTKADYAVIGDLHEVLPAVTALVRAREE